MYNWWSIANCNLCPILYPFGDMVAGGLEVDVENRQFVLTPVSYTALGRGKPLQISG